MLIDSNIFIEIPRQQANYRDCLNLLKIINNELIEEQVFITGFALHALEAVISKFDPEFLKRILLMIYQDKIKVFNTEIADDLMILSSMKDLGLDFDDATQYLATNKLGTYIVTFDKSFNGKGIEIKTPAEVLKKIIKDYK